MKAKSRPAKVATSQKAMRMRRGQTLVEYALILALISIVAVIVLQSLGQQVTQVYSTINNRIEAPSGS